MLAQKILRKIDETSHLISQLNNTENIEKKIKQINLLMIKITKNG